MADERDETPDDDVPTGLPEGEDDATPLGVDDEQQPAEGEEALPGIATEDDPEVSG